MITKEKLKDYANKLMFDMDESEYETLQNEFDVILKQSELIGKIKGIDTIEPMTFPYSIYTSELREDEAKECLTTEEVLENASEVKYNQVKVPKVVG
ncbi:MAG: Asp-tRNA(Asn)/Glu-tRNA(Gln) amidotransferase subunit GatC [Bacilli bacterium]|nr:Asp-tRNA(Asn)/Glu-tRNA(Gln) amidotransferase subunit GatC [Bacilli bacterium]MDD4808613.1 Asp-tRNA(Asn)/Glu-tRNA(Gln) amidotransferase subunit GatC [Bacilli bacterium]